MSATKKSVIIIDTPTTCRDCEYGNCKHKTGKNTRPKDCIARPLPDKRNCNEFIWNDYHAGFDQGVNWTIGEITGEKYTPPAYQGG